MAYPFNPDLKIGEATYNDNEYLGLERLDKARQVGSLALKEYLNTAVVYAYGSNGQYGSKNFPLLFQTQGLGKKRGVKSIDGVYYNYLLGKPKKTSTIAKTIHSVNGETGRGNTDFYLIFRDRLFQKNQIIHNGGIDGIQLQITAQPTQEGSFWKYRCKIFGGKPNQSVPYSALKAGAVWSGGVIKVSLERSRGTENRSYSPYEIQNQLSLIRQSINVAGNAAKKVMNFELTLDGQKFKLWYDFERYLTELTWNEQKDIDLLVSKYNKDADGVIVNYDADTGLPVTSGAGIWDQIPSSNEMLYSMMTEAKLRNYISDILALVEQLDFAEIEVVIDVMGGIMFLEAVDEALKRNTSLLTPMPASDMFITKVSGGLRFGNYFTEYKHRSGAVFRFSHHRGFDYGPLAESDERHPLNPSRPLMSGNAFIANFGLVNVDSKVNSKGRVANVEYVYEEGREYIERNVLGMAHLPGAESQFAATDIDASALHMMCSQGIHMYFPMGAGKIACTLS